MREQMANSSACKEAILISKIGMEEILQFPSMVRAAEYLGISRSQVSKYIKNNKPYKEFTITKLSETINSSEKLNRKPYKQPILVTNIKTGESQEFSSIADASRYINLTPMQLRNALKKDVHDIEINDFKFTKLTVSSSQFEPNNISIEVTNVKTQEVSVYSSITSAAKAIGTYQPSLSAYLNKNSSRPTFLKKKKVGPLLAGGPFKGNFLIRILD